MSGRSSFLVHSYTVHGPRVWLGRGKYRKWSWVGGVVRHVATKVRRATCIFGTIFDGNLGMTRSEKSGFYKKKRHRILGIVPSMVGEAGEMAESQRG